MFVLSSCVYVLSISISISKELTLFLPGWTNSTMVNDDDDGVELFSLSPIDMSLQSKIVNEYKLKKGKMMMMMMIKWTERSVQFMAHFGSFIEQKLYSVNDNETCIVVLVSSC